MNSLSMNLLLAAEQTTVNAVDSALSGGAAGASRGWLVFLAVLGVIIVPFVLGNLIARALRMRDYGTKIGLVLFSLTLALWPFATRWVNGQNPMDAISLGIDLAGGTNMVFAVDREAAVASGKEVTAELMDKMVLAVSRRVNPTGTEEVTVRRVGNDRVEVIVPGADQEKVDSTIRKIVDLGKLEFSILANEVEHQQLIAQAEKLGDTVNEIYRGSQLIGKWRPSAVDQVTGAPKVMPGDQVRTRMVKRNGKDVLQYLVVVDPDPKQRIDGDLLKGVREAVTDRGLAVGFTFNDRGGHLMQKLTSQHEPRPGGHKTRLAVLLNEEVHSAPTINAVIGNTGVIEGSFTQEEIDDLISVLNAGALQVPLYAQPVSEFTISPTLGEDVQRRGLSAMAWSMVAVFAVTGFYYLYCGLIANVCLLLNLILVLGAMSLIDATFTLPGLAGLVLSVGMAVDSNVLIFERMREERERGSSVRLAIKNGFEKAFGTIFDSNVTTLITAVVLYYIGTEQVKGFAVTLFIGIVISMFTAVYVGRIIFDIAERKRWLTDLKMLNAIPSGNFDFLGKRKLAVGFSLLLMLAGLLMVGYRGRDNLDIDFRGGSLVTFKFADDAAPGIEEVRDALDTKFEKSLSLERLIIDQGGKPVVLFRMRTIEADPRVVSESIRSAFAETPLKLVQQHASATELAQIAAPPADQAQPTSDSPADTFIGGHEATLKFNQPVLPGALAEEAILFLKTNKKLDNASDMVSAKGLGASETKANEVQLRFAKTVPAADATEAVTTLVSRLDGAPYFEEVNTFDASVAGDTQAAALWAIGLSFLAIIGYLWIRFQHVTFGVAACIALLHDILITLGLVAFGAYFSGNPIGQFFMLEDFKINLTIVAAFLTIIGYSLNDTIVVFDRIREVRGRNPLLTDKMVNQSLNQTLSRTLLTSVTTLIVVIIMYFMGGDGIHGFAYCLTLGILVGTFSSIYVASPVLLWLTNRKIRQSPTAA